VPSPISRSVTHKKAGQNHLTQPDFRARVMKWTISYLEKDGIVHIKATGNITWDENKKLNEELLAVGRKNNVNTFMVDYRDLNFNLSVLEIDELPIMLRNIGISPKDRVAILFDHTSAHSSLFSLLQNVLCLKSLPARTFAEPMEAIAWLKSQQ
jgi:hypothetical protein